jgi:hypothetical protein
VNAYLTVTVSFALAVEVTFKMSVIPGQILVDADAGV